MTFLYGVPVVGFLHCCPFFLDCCSSLLVVRFRNSSILMFLKVARCWVCYSVACRSCGPVLLWLEPRDWIFVSPGGENCPTCTTPFRSVNSVACGLLRCARARSVRTFT